MTALSTLRTTVRQYINEEDSDNSSFTDDEIDGYLNQAVTFLGTEMEWSEQTSQTTVVTDQATYQLPDNFIAVVDVYFDNKKIPVIERVDLAAINTSWQDDDSSTPRYAYKADVNVIGLYPPPDADSDGLTLQIQYIQIPDTLTTDTDVPDLHPAFQICLPFYAAFLCDYKLGKKQQAEIHIKLYQMHKQALKSRVQKYAEDLVRFRWANSYE